MTTPRPDGPRLDPARFRLAISLILTFGVWTSGILVGIGLILALVFGWQSSLVGSTSRVFAATDFSAVTQNLTAVRPIGIVQAGLLVLLATPVVRVMAAFVGFALERDRLYVVISATVLAILLVSLAAVR